MWIDENIRQINFVAGNNVSKKYKVEAIWDNGVYPKELTGYLPRFYYLVSWKSYP